MIKFKEPEQMKMWGQAEKALSTSLAPEIRPEVLRTSGLLAAQNFGWKSALVRFDEAVSNGIRDLQTLDAFGEAAYQAGTCQALIPYQDLYRDPMIAVHMARAFTILGHIDSAREFLSLASETLLSVALEAILGVEKSIENAAASMVKATKYPGIENLSFVEFWQALSPIAEVIGRKDLVQLAERRLKALAYIRPVVHYNQSLRFLLEGEFRAGWKLYDWRLVPGSPCAATTECADLSMWEGEFITDKRILVVMENGFGDQIFGLRFLRCLMQEHPAHLEVAVGPELAELVQTSFPALTVHDLKACREPAYWENKPRPDFWTYCFSVPARADFFEPCFTEGYLRAPDSALEFAKTQIASKNPRGLPVCGIVWHGDIRTAPMRTRAYSLDQFLAASKVLERPAVIVSLQKDITPEEKAELATRVEKVGGVFIDASSTLENFAITAGWIESLDQLFSCDTATAHLGGALGVSTTVLIRNKAIWNWRSHPGRLQSVWYDSCKIQYALAPAISYMFDIRNA